MSQSAFNHKLWEERGLKDFEEYSDCITYINQTEMGDGTLEGEWFYGDDENKTIYFGTFGNYNSPGADSYTFADKYDEEYEDDCDYRNRLAALEDMPEYLEIEEEEESTDEE